ncbi:MAG: hypothetical protein ACFE9N_07340 [Promethearchaeota archaeon]
MRKKQILAILLAVIFVNVASISLAFLVTAKTESKFADLQSYLANRDYKSIDGSHRLEGKSIEDLPFLAGITTSTVQPSTTETWVVNCSDDFYGGIYEQEFECVLEGELCNIWIGLNPDIWDDGFQDEFVPGATFEENKWYFAYPWSNIGIDAAEAGAPDPDEDGYYLPPGYRDWITGEDLIEIKDEFDGNIHDSVVDHFGEYSPRPGPLGDFKIQVLIFNIRDGLFYDPIGAGWFIIGYFWSKVSDENNANIFHMDTYQWWRRQGYPTEIFYGLGPLPVQYEGTFAHEFQHLVHHDVDDDELSWVNEGCSVLAELICGYGFPAGHISEYLIYWWDISLTFWQGTLADYGVTFLWTYYMWEHYGGDQLIWDLVHHQDNGIAAWNDLLITYGNGKDFDAIFQDWALANYLDDTSIAGGIYGYYGLDIPSTDTEGFSIPLVMEMWQSGDNTPFFNWLVNNYPTSGMPYPYGSSLPYVANYVRFYKEGASHMLTVEFDGDDFCGVPAWSGDYKWHSGGDGWAWYRLGQTFTIPEGGATLSFMSNFEIEEEWDFGYVEVHDLNTDEWCTLPGTLTVADVGFNYQTDNPNCPAGFEPTDYYDAGTWNAFTGSSGGWYLESMDLSPFSGHDIELYFTYWTDPYTLEAGWYIDDISIPELAVPFFDNVEAGPDGWTVNNGWFRSDILYDNDFNVNFIDFFNVYGKNGVLLSSTYSIESMCLDPVTETGLHEAPLIDNGGFELYSVMVVANQPGFEHTFGSSYTFMADVLKVEGSEWWWRWLFGM